MDIQKNIQRQIFIEVSIIADRDLQVKLWLEGGFPDFISSYSEVQNMLDDLGFEDFLNNNKFIDGYAAEIQIDLIELNRLLFNYDDTDKSDKEIINDPKWDRIVKLASVVIEKFYLKNPLKIYTFEELKSKMI